ncbi:Cell wall-associated hydrolase, NlpC family [Halomonas korlensis]|uniref:Cell wall-associated hydrolase, NlpC family n=1 Tax=Halomonas korlensis TaxID=463301 RepID=A0A1I7FWQ1_9GAMM|nr:Cell wall-associated hydrolase, NlpC family [Halomonas korlensis]
MSAPRSYRITIIVACVAFLVGCANAPHDPGAQPVPDDYFAQQLPGLPDDWDPMMSPIDNPVRNLERFQQPSPAVVRQALLDQHERWVGTPYRLGGTTGQGVDCSALVQNIFSDSFRYELPRTTGEQVELGEAVVRSQLQAGDLVFFQPPGPYRHVGIYLGEGLFLHASRSQGVMISELDNHYWQRYYWQARRPLEPVQLAQRAATTGNG